MQNKETLNMHEEILIRCEDHNTFFITTPHDHLNLSWGGCPFCKQEIMGYNEDEIIISSTHCSECFTEI